MIAINLSLEQLIDAIQHLNDAEKRQVLKALDNADVLLTEEQEQEILDRESEYKAGRMKTYSLEEVKTSFNLPG